MITLRLPRLGGTRDAATTWLNANVGAYDDLHGETVVLLGRDLLSSSESFADQIVKRLLSDDRVGSIILVAPPKQFSLNMRAAAERRGFGGRVRKESAASLGV